MIADHLGSGDYAFTRVVFIGTLVLAAGAGAVSTLIIKRWGWARVLGLIFAASLGIAATRMLFAWDSITDAADRFTSDGLQLRNVDDFTAAAFGGRFALVLVGLGTLFAAASVAERRRPEYAHDKHNAPPV